ncbi:uncharacterized protein K452DRAFT_303247 [Aplosporella prunicola CBS 121167]|uniref:Zn(2)-C6 fungal-type domain-containing protein n=1 Tax=Aplosporella prunicola CBS 121167 TaxID=1176127 RepID=A0A6A6AZF1_9PEZI|nr:uncharacterized protein K452DRAFT_303247 [Aplosporella prunicola CBS 121167]KAF2135851.1 hypothetical protein K452DRAFT_303247 [Aplosporella prunicola CBS 121167]
MAVLLLEHSEARRQDKAGMYGDLGSQHGMSYIPSVPVSGIGVAQPFAQPLFDSVDGSDHTRGARAYPITASDDQTAKKRRPSKGKPPLVIKRSSSTPHMRALGFADSGQISPNSEKRRNKLGYHRTSVACGHCRRRKIRCLIAPEDAQGRCSNCIRLKKECNFYPVEQQPSGDSRSQNAKRGSVSAVTSTSNSSSPRASTASGHEQVEEYSSYQQLPSGDQPPSYGVSTEFDSHVDMKSQNGVIPQTSSFNYSPSFDVGAWSSDYAARTSSDANSDGSSIAYWSAPGTSMSSAFFDDAPNPMQQTHGLPPNLGNPQQLQDENIWPGVARSMSFSGPDGMHPDYRFQHANTMPIQQGGLRSSMDVSSAPMNPNIRPASTFPFSAPQGWQPYMTSAPISTPPGPAQPFAANWFPGQVSLGAVEEENNAGNPYQRY